MPLKCEYQCECGFEGPHVVHYDSYLRVYVAECADSACGVEFTLPKDAKVEPL